MACKRAKGTDLSVRNFWTISQAKIAQVQYKYFPAFTFLFASEFMLSVVIINFVKYTEIDWNAYMEEVGGFMNGTLNYTLLKGGTGPLVYPAGFVYFYSSLLLLTNLGSNIRLAQYIFMFFYLINLLIVWKIYRKCGMPLVTVVPMSLFAYRIHSIFMLRMFNDCICALFTHLSIVYFIRYKFYPAAVIFSLALSIKMNALMFLPGILTVLVCCGGMLLCAKFVAIVFFSQMIIGAPFIFNAPREYFTKSFEFSRQFFFKWTVNWRFLGEDLFLDSSFHMILLLAHVLLLAAFGWFRWRPKHLTLKDIVSLHFRGLFPPLEANRIVRILFESNFIGIICCRTLHYQFYSWYYHTIPFLLYACNVNLAIASVLFLAIEYCWNVYPSTNFSSFLLFISHSVILVLLWFGKTENGKTRRK